MVYKGINTIYDINNSNNNKSNSSDFNVIFSTTLDLNANSAITFTVEHHWLMVDGSGGGGGGVTGVEIWSRITNNGPSWSACRHGNGSIWLYCLPFKALAHFPIRHLSPLPRPFSHLFLSYYLHIYLFCNIRLRTDFKSEYRISQVDNNAIGYQYWTFRRKPFLRVMKDVTQFFFSTAKINVCISPWI